MRLRGIEIESGEASRRRRRRVSRKSISRFLWFRSELGVPSLRASLATSLELPLVFLLGEERFVSQAYNEQTRVGLLDIYYDTVRNADISYFTNKFAIYPREK